MVWVGDVRVGGFHFAFFLLLNDRGSGKGVVATKGVFACTKLGSPTLCIVFQIYLSESVRVSPWLTATYSAHIVKTHHSWTHSRVRLLISGINLHRRIVIPLLVGLQSERHGIELLLEKLLLKVNISGRVRNHLPRIEQLPRVVHLVIEVIVLLLLSLQTVRWLPAARLAPGHVTTTLPRRLFLPILWRHHTMLLLLEFPLLTKECLLLQNLLVGCDRVHPLCKVHFLLHVGRRVVNLLLRRQHLHRHHHGHHHLCRVVVIWVVCTRCHHHLLHIPKLLLLLIGWWQTQELLLLLLLL